jgi:mono/diheme cytochrome c family protein
MTEVPEHLLRRSRERREALGLSAGEGGEGAAPPPAEEPAAAPAGASVPATTAPAPAPVAAAAAAVPAPVIEEPVPEPAYIRLNEKQRSKNPLWVMPVLIGLPLWAFFYAFAFSPPKKTGPVDPLVLGATVYKTAGCSGCHGAAGEGGVGPKLAGGEAKLTFPNIADQISWVKTGSGPFTGQKYGDPNRPGGQHGPAKGIMPAFAGSLSDAQINAVVTYEREKL